MPKPNNENTQEIVIERRLGDNFRVVAMTTGVFRKVEYHAHDFNHLRDGKVTVTRILQGVAGEERYYRFGQGARYDLREGQVLARVQASTTEELTQFDLFSQRCAAEERKGMKSKSKPFTPRSDNAPSWAENPFAKLRRRK